MHKLLLPFLLLLTLPYLSFGKTERKEFAKDTIMGAKTVEYTVPLSGNIVIEMYPTKIVRPMGISLVYLRSTDGQQWNTYKTEQMEPGGLEKNYKTKIACDKCKVRVEVKQLSLFEFRLVATKETP